MGKHKIDDRLLIALINQGVQQKEIAERMGVTPPAICQRLKVLTRTVEPESLKKLTDKERRFVIEKAKGLTNTQAVVNSYEVTSLKSAKAVGSNLMKKPEIRGAIDDLMENEGIGRRERVRKLKRFMDDPNSHVGIKALDIGFKLGNDYPAQRQVNLNANVQIDPVDLSRFRNYELNRTKPNQPDLEGVIEGEIVPESELSIDKYRNGH